MLMMTLRRPGSLYVGEPGQCVSSALRRTRAATCGRVTCRWGQSQSTWVRQAQTRRKDPALAGRVPVAQTKVHAGVHPY